MSKKISPRRSAQFFKTELKTFVSICQECDTPRSLTAYLLATHGEWKQYLDLSFPDTMSDTFEDDYLVTEAFRKHPRLPNCYSKEERKSTSLEAWLSAEQHCLATNERIDHALQGYDHTLNELLHRISIEVLAILGPLGTKELNYAEREFSFGPGSSSSVRKDKVVPSQKYVASMDVTPRLYPYTHAILCNGAWRKGGHTISLVGHSKLSFVPKTSKVDRPICTEPHLNMRVQKGIGSLLRLKLRQSGIDLDNQAEQNKLQASRAHLDDLATIDLSAASDSISYKLVWACLPFEWAALLDLARTEYTLLPDGTVHRLNKFSSMGNGYTFELETLLFLAISRVVCGRSSTICVFGDDIICPQRHARELVEVLGLLGFSTNNRKTFLAGKFFESCGSDWLNGKNVRPFYYRGFKHDTIQSTFRLLNRIRFCAHRRNSYYGCDARLLPAWLRAFHSLKQKYKSFRGPVSTGDITIHSNFDEACTKRRERFGWEGWRVAARVGVPVKSRHTSEHGAYWYALDKAPYNGVEIKKRNSDTTVGSLLQEPTRGRTKVVDASTTVWEWYHLGPWL